MWEGNGERSVRVGREREGGEGMDGIFFRPVKLCEGVLLNSVAVPENRW